MVLIKSSIVRASEVLKVLNEEQKLDQEYVECDVEIPQEIIDNLTYIFENPSVIENILDFQSLPALFYASSFLQMPVLVDLLMQLLNRLCQYDDPALVPLQGTINVYWLRDCSKIKAATKVWLGLLSIPLKSEEEDDSCFSSLKLLSGKLQHFQEQISFKPFSFSRLQDCSRPLKKLVTRIIECTDNDKVCIALLDSFIKTISYDLCFFASKAGRLNLLQLAREKSLPWDERTLDAAACHGHVEILQWARANGCPGDIKSCNYFTRSQHLKVLQWVKSQEPSFTRNKYVCVEAARCGHLEILQWARANGCPWDKWTCANAAQGGHLEVLQWARANDCPWDSNTCSEAAKGGHLEFLQWARANGCPWNSWTCTNAALGGHLEVLQWARSQNPPCPWDSKTCSEAAAGGHLEVLQWLRSQEPSCPWDEMTCANAAQEGHLEVLYWARTQSPPCPWDEMTCAYAAQGGHLQVLQWARTQSPPCPWDRWVGYFGSNLDGNKNIMHWAYANGYSPSDYLP